MESLRVYGMQQFAIGNEAKFRAMVALSLDMVATVQGWNESDKKSKAECESALSIALTMARVPETSARRVLATVSGLALQLNKAHRATLESLKTALVSADNAVTPEQAVDALAVTLRGEGVENLAFLEAYARKGKPGVAALAAELDTKRAEAEAKAARNEEQAKADAEAEAEAQAEAAESRTPRAKAAKQAAGILAALAKHGENMTAEEIDAIAAAVAALVSKQVRLAQEAEAARAYAAAVAEAEAQAA